MCTIIEHGIRINKIMSHTLNMRLDNRPATLDELTDLCIRALRIYYDGTCPEECFESKARDYAAWHLAKLAHERQQASGKDEPSSGCCGVRASAVSGEEKTGRTIVAVHAEAPAERLFFGQYRLWMARYSSQDPLPGLRVQSVAAFFGL